MLTGSQNHIPLLDVLVPEHVDRHLHTVLACARTRQQTAHQGSLVLHVVNKLFNSENLNSEYYKDDVQIGHTYFLVTSVEQLYLRFRYQIIPILREYYKDGMFQLETPETDTDGWYGLLGWHSRL